MEFVSGGVQKDLDSKHLLRHSTSSSWSVPYLICLRKHLPSPSVRHNGFSRLRWYFLPSKLKHWTRVKTWIIL